MNHSRPERRRLDRRTFLLGAASIGVLASCASDSTSTDGDTNTDAGTADTDAGAGEGTASGDQGFLLIQRFPSDVFVAGEVRLPFSLSDERATFVTDGPATLAAQIFDAEQNPVGARVEATRRDVTPAPYYAFRTQIDTPGIYSIVVEGGPPEGANFQVFEPTAVGIPKPGELLPGFETPTVDRAAGVDPICTRDPQCEFHSLTLAEALATAQPVAFYVGTPAFCTTGSCTPALEALIELAPEFSDRLVVIHAEVYTDLAATETSPAVVALGLEFEPALFITNADGVIVERMDAVWETTELRERLEAALA